MRTILSNKSHRFIVIFGILIPLCSVFLRWIDPCMKDGDPTMYFPILSSWAHGCALSSLSEFMLATTSLPATFSFFIVRSWLAQLGVHNGSVLVLLAGLLALIVNCSVYALIVRVSNYPIKDSPKS